MKTVRQLIEELRCLPQDHVVVTTGKHGNYTPFDCIREGDLRYEADSTWSGDVHQVDEWLEDNDPEDGEECPGVPCVVLCGVC